MPKINEFFTSKPESNHNNNVKVIDQARPCSKCNLSSPSYNFDEVSLEMYWKCPDGHETKYKLN
jgi:hypothetical protein